MAPRSTHWRVGLAVAAFGGGAIAPALVPAQPVPATPAASTAAVPVPARGRALPVEVVINGVRSGSWTLFERDGALYAPSEAFQEWRLIHGGTSTEVRGERWYSLSEIPGFNARYNFGEQTMELEFSPAAFNAVRLTSAGPPRPDLTPSIPAAFLNYDLNHQVTANRRTGQGLRDTGALLEAGISGPRGLLTTSQVARNLFSRDPALPTAWRRLETTYTYNFLDNNSTLRLGDTHTRGNLTTQPVYFGGVQFGKNYALQPGFVTQPIASLSGVSSAPSTVELFINNSLRQVTQVPPGPFRIDNFPGLTGAGEARVVVRDILGRETIITQSFLTSANMLEQGLSDWSFEAGWTRRNLGGENADYGPLFAAGSWRQGLSKALTVEGNAEVSRDTSRAGVGAVYALPFGVLGQSGMSVSRSSGGMMGANWQLGADRSNLRHGIAVNATGATQGYRQIGFEAGVARVQAVAAYTYSHPDFGVLSTSYGVSKTASDGRVQTANVGYTMRVGERATVNFLLARVLGRTSGTTFGVSALIPLDSRALVSAGTTHRTGGTDSFATYALPLSAETGWGWRGTTGHRSATRYTEGGAYYQGARGFASADVSTTSQEDALRLGAVGGLVAVEGRLFASRRVQDSFAIVEVPGYPGVGVGFHSGNLTKTDVDGIALVPRLLPFQRNSIRLDPSQLPISAELDSIEMDAVPGSRSAVKITFPVRQGRGALLRIVLDDGQPAPAGAELELLGDAKDFFVARRGEAFVTGLKPSNQVRLQWKGRSCLMDVVLPPGSPDEIARVGPLSCTGVAR